MGKNLFSKQKMTSFPETEEVLKNHQEGTFKKEGAQQEMHDSFMITLTIS